MSHIFTMGGGVKHDGQSLKERVSEVEWNARVELALCYRLIAHFGLTDTIYNHISYRIPGEEEHLLLNPFGLLYEEVTASSLIKVDVEGNILDDTTGLGINKAGFIIHGAIHEARPDVNCVLHTHTDAGLAVAANAAGLLPISQPAALFMNRIGYHDYEGIVLRMDERQRLVKNLGAYNFLILRNHGLLTAGASIAKTFQWMLILQQACSVQVKALAGNPELTELTPAAIEEAQVAHDQSDAEVDWQALRRMIDRYAPDYRD
ncbi:class II aldolase/adducin family protein [Kineobactrum salinum]|uniref:Class II aldolase/adducin family protein n=1 Tax=Kineobactrum salinum TaxID=2708301 RepID=A0A6C0TX76_9GAMM|nr:class II aldolase/adducin family protein [Kineobactrum salinum]QIB64123.1 class II aldolase/adducin family protein [Kineobactrum salinum]